MPSIALFPEQASTTAHSVDLLLLFLSIVCGGVGLLVATLLIYFSIKYRRRPGEVCPPAETVPSRPLEWFWTLAPLGILAVMFLLGAIVYVDAYHAPDDATVIYGVGRQWMWKFQHPDGQRDHNELHVPVGNPIACCSPRRMSFIAFSCRRFACIWTCCRSGSPRFGFKPRSPALTICFARNIAAPAMPK